MCECGCTLSDRKYKFPGPGKSFYIVSLCGWCVSCDAPSGVTIERIDSKHILYEEYKRGDFLEGDLTFDNWADTVGAAIVTGMTSAEFVRATKSHLIGVNSKDFGRDGKISEIGANEILEEMYEEAQKRPTLVVQEKRKARLSPRERAARGGETRKT